MKAVADPARPPVAIRIVRPYDTEEAFLENELETVGKTSVILIGAHPRPTGVILRFEVTLASGATVLRGEGRVLGHKESAFRGQPGLSLRFTRLDRKSKALVDRAAAMREARLSGDAVSAPPPPPPPASSRPAAAPAPAPEPAPSSSAPVASAAPSSEAPQSERPSPPPPSTSVPAPDPVLAEILTSPTPPPPVPSAAAPAPEPQREQAAPEDSAPSPPSLDREALLDKLRRRAASLTEEQKANILRAWR